MRRAQSSFSSSLSRFLEIMQDLIGDFACGLNKGESRIIAIQEILKIKRVCIEEKCKEECLKNKEFSELAKKFEEVLFSPKFDKTLPSDLVVTIGGDGTVMWALKWFKNQPIPPIITFDAAVRV
jgi:NAD kinase